MYIILEAPERIWFFCDIVLHWKIPPVFHHPFSNILFFLFHLYYCSTLIKVPYLSCWGYYNIFLTGASSMYSWPTLFFIMQLEVFFSYEFDHITHLLKLLKSFPCSKYIWQHLMWSCSSLPIYLLCPWHPLFHVWAALSLVPQNIRFLSNIAFATFPPQNVPHQPFIWLSPTQPLDLISNLHPSWKPSLLLYPRSGPQYKLSYHLNPSLIVLTTLC